MDIISDSGAEPAAVLVALDRQEKGPNGKSAIQEIEETYKIPVLAIAKLENLLEFAQSHPGYSGQLEQLTAYRQTYGIE